MSKIEDTLFPLDGWDMTVLERAAERINENIKSEIVMIDDKSFIEYGTLYGVIDSLIYEVDRLLEENEELEQRLWTKDEPEEVPREPLTMMEVFGE